MIKRFLGLSLFFFFCISGICRAEESASLFDHSSWGKFLAKYVNEKGEINYTAAKQDPSLLNEYLKSVEKIDWEVFHTEWPREEKLAVSLNTYHAALVHLILQYYPVQSVQKIPGFWDMESINIAGHHFSLNGFRQNILMGVYHDEKIHTVLSYGAKSGPVLSKEPFTSHEVDAQLFLAAQRFVNDNRVNQIEPGKKKIEISKIFEWYAGDFTLSYGAFENDRDLPAGDYSVLSFLTHYLTDEKKIQYLENAKYKIRYLPFNWDLNDWKENPKAAKV